MDDARLQEVSDLLLETLKGLETKAGREARCFGLLTVALTLNSDQEELTLELPKERPIRDLTGPYSESIVRLDEQLAVLEANARESALRDRSEARARLAKYRAKGLRPLTDDEIGRVESACARGDAAELCRIMGGLADEESHQ